MFLSFVVGLLDLGSLLVVELTTLAESLEFFGSAYGLAMPLVPLR